MGIEIQMIGRQVEKRQAKRYRFRGGATVRPLDTDSAQKGYILDLSERGCLLRLPDVSDFAIDTLVDLRVSSPAVSFLAVGSVRRCDPHHLRLGISFENLTPRGAAELQRLIDELEEAQRLGRTCVQKIRVTLRDAPPPAAEPEG